MTRQQLAVTLGAALLAAVIVARWVSAPMPQTRGGRIYLGRDPRAMKRLSTKLSPDVAPDQAGVYPQHIAHPLELGLSVLAGPHPMYRHASSMSPNCAQVAASGWAGWAFDPPSEVDI